MSPREKAIRILDIIILSGLAVFFASASLSISVIKLSSGFLILLPWIIKSIIERRISGAFWTKLEIPILVFLLVCLITSLASYRIGGWDYVIRALGWFPHSATFFLVIFMVAFNLRGKYRRPLCYLLILGAVLNSLVALGQFTHTIFTSGSLMENRPSGMLFYMTFGSIVVMAASLSLSMAVFDQGGGWRRVILWLSFAVLTLGCAVSLVRSALLGLFVTIFTIILLKGRKIFIIIPLLFIMVLMLVPQVRERVTETFIFGEGGLSLKLANEYDERLYIYRSGWEMVRRYPILGVGMRNVAWEYTHFREKEAVRHYSHLHNNILQVSAQSGVIGLASFIALIVSFFWVTVRRFKLKDAEDGHPPLDRALAVAAIAGLAGFLGVGIFEYNFGDYESCNFLMILLGLALSRSDSSN